MAKQRPSDDRVKIEDVSRTGIQLFIRLRKWESVGRVVSKNDRAYMEKYAKMLRRCIDLAAIEWKK